jgi:hypothetical protein
MKKINLIKAFIATGSITAIAIPAIALTNTGCSNEGTREIFATFNCEFKALYQVSPGDALIVSGTKGVNFSSFPTSIASPVEGLTFERSMFITAGASSISYEVSGTPYTSYMSSMTVEGDGLSCEVLLEVN